MKVCQIATVGRNPEWIQLGLYRYSTDLLVLVTTESYYVEAEKVKQLVQGMVVRIEVIEQPRNPEYVVIFLKKLINSLEKEDYSILINVTSGLVSWQLLFYSTATILRDKVKKFYIIDKEKKEPLEMILYKPLTKTEARTLLSIPEMGGSLKEITENFRKLMYKETAEAKGSSGLISKYLKLLVDADLVKTTGGSKKKRFQLTKQGKIVRETIS